MVDTKTEQERDKLHCVMWTIADEIRGVLDVCTNIQDRKIKKLWLNIEAEQTWKEA